MNTKSNTTNENFYKQLSEHIGNSEEVSLKKIYSLFPGIKTKTISWRLYSLAQEGKIHKTGHGYYAMSKMREHNALGYDYLQKKSQMVYDILIEYGYNFYITGLDALIGELLHIPEKYPVLLVVEESGIKEIREVLSEKGLIVITEKNRDIIKDSILKNKMDVIILQGKDFSLATNHIAQKEKAFIDLYYATTRMEYGISIAELSRIYQSMQRNNAIATMKIKRAARDRKITNEIIWLSELNKLPGKAREFMIHQTKEAK